MAIGSASRDGVGHQRTRLRSRKSCWILRKTYKGRGDTTVDHCPNREYHLEAHHESHRHDHICEFVVGIEGRIEEPEIQIACQPRQYTGHDRTHYPHVPDEVIVDDLNNTPVLQDGPSISCSWDVWLSIDRHLTIGVFVHVFNESLQASYLMATRD